MKLPPSIIRYWLAMNATAFDAGVHSLVIFCGVAGVHEVGPGAVPSLNLQQLAAVFCITFGRAMLAYLDEHPVAALLPIADSQLPIAKPGQGLVTSTPT